MSRQTVHNAGYEIAYGHDHVFGFFIQVFDRRKWNDDDVRLVLDLDQMRHNLTPSKMVEVALDYRLVIPLLDEKIGLN